MNWFNYYGLAVMVVIMLPNIVYAVKHKQSGEHAPVRKPIMIAEQIGRYACFALMIFNVPYTYFGFWFPNAFLVYLCGNGGLCFAYLLFWIICWNSNGKLRALSLSVLPSCMFLFCGVILANIPLLAFSALFAASHIYISYQDASHKQERRVAIRAYRETDCKTLSALFYETVHAVNAADYTREQLSAWAHDKNQLQTRQPALSSQRTLVAEINGKTVGFGSIDAAGCLDLLFVHKDFQRQGIATALCDRLEQGYSVLKTYASITAKPFFERRGYEVVREQEVFRYGIALKNYEMQKTTNRSANDQK